MSSIKSSYKDLLSSIRSNASANQSQAELAINMPKTLPGENILDDTLLNVKSSELPPAYMSLSTQENSNLGECPYSHKKGNVSGCPFMNSRNHEPKDKKFDYHYEVPMMETARDFYFNTINYTKDKLKESTWVRSMPKYLRNTLFIKNKKIEEIRKKEYSMIFLIIEDLKEKVYETYKDKKYDKAINSYTLIYSMLKWLEFKDKEKETTVLEKIDFSNDNAIVDNDLIVRRVNTDDAVKYEEDSFKTSVIYILKSLSYCYIHLRHYSDAIKCMDEAMQYATASKPDILFRKSQAVMYNKFSSVKELENALADMKEAQRLKKEKDRNDPLLDEHVKELEDLIKEKEFTEVGYVKGLIESMNYAYDVITKKKLNVHDHIYAHYDDIHFNYMIVMEMKDCYYSSIKFFQDTKNEKQLKKIIEEFEKFFDFYFPYTFFYKLTLSNISERTLSHLSEEEKSSIEKAKINETMKLLFNDFRLKKCEEYYGNCEWNMTIWKYCFDTVNEREKKKRAEKEKKEKEARKAERWKMIKNPFQNTTQVAVFSMLLLTLSLLAIGYHVMYYWKDNKNNFIH